MCEGRCAVVGVVSMVCVVAKVGKPTPAILAPPVLENVSCGI